MEKVFVTGGSGLVGSRVVEAICEKYEVTYSFNRNPNAIGSGTPLQLDISSETCIKKIVELKPDVVVHTSALADVDYCEKNPHEAYAVNVNGTRNVAIACREVGAKMVHLSTDYVFDGTKGGYSEEDVPNPINRYGHGKLESERIVASMLNDWVLARTTVIFGWNRIWQRKNFAAWVIDSLRHGTMVRLVTDQFSSPTLAENLAGALVELAASNKKGVYHIVGNDCLSRFDFGLKIADVFSLDPGLITPVTSEELSQAAPRPKKNCLSNKKAARELETRLLNAEEALEIMEQQEEVK